MVGVDGVIWNGYGAFASAYLHTYGSKIDLDFEEGIFFQFIAVIAGQDSLFPYFTPEKKHLRLCLCSLSSAKRYY
jgi:hypothetical protein